jgi:DNA-binding transcriptional regulator YdaS (Cro superfamily)
MIIICALTLGQMAQAQLLAGYNVRSAPGSRSSVVGSTSDNCQLTGQHNGVSREVRCVGANGTYTGWVNRMGVEPNYRNQRISTLDRVATRPTPAVAPRTQSTAELAAEIFRPENVRAAVTPPREPAPRVPAPVVRPEPAIQAAARLPQPQPPAGPGEAVNNFMSIILDRTPNRIQETRVINARRGTRASVDLVRMPEVPVQGDQLGSPLCGAHRARDRSPLYFTRQAGCLMTAVAQEWRRNHCPNNDAHCRLVVGDASHGESVPSSWPHNTHRDGRCIDIYLPRRPGGGLTSEAGNNRTHDPRMTQALVNLLVEHGGAPNSGAHNSRVVIYDGGGANTIRIGGHSNHIHVCFPENAANGRRCASTSFDTNLCPELGGPAQQQMAGPRPGGGSAAPVTSF